MKRTAAQLQRLPRHLQDKRGVNTMEGACVAGNLSEILPRGRETRLRRSSIFAAAVGAAIIIGFTSYVIHRQYRVAVSYWKARISASVPYRVWIVGNSIQESQFDSQVLANFDAMREVLLFRKSNVAASSVRDGLRRQVFELFRNYARIFDYPTICLLDFQGRVVVQVSHPSARVDLLETTRFQELLQDIAYNKSSAVALIGDGADGRVLAFATPVFDSDSGQRTHDGSNLPIGFVAILDSLSREVDRLLTESTPTDTGETLLFITRDGESLYASPRRLLPSGPAQLSHATDTLKLAVTSAREDRVIFVESVDYRGVAVMAAAQKIPSLDAIIVSKVDREEALAEFHRTVRLEVAVATALLLAYIVTILGLSRTAESRALGERLVGQQRLLAAQEQTDGVLREAKEILETKVAERTSQLAAANQQLLRELAERRAAEGRLSVLVNSAMDAIITVDDQRLITLFNPAAERTFGCRSVEMLGQRLDRLIPERFRSAAADPSLLFGQINVARPKTGALHLICALHEDGTEFAGEASITKIEVEGHKHFMVILRDVTERIATEEWIRKVNAELEERVRDRTAKLAASNKELQDFAYSLTHDFKGPLRGVITWSELVLRDYGDRFDPEPRALLERACSEARRLGGLIEDLLHLFHLGRQEPILRVADLSALAQGVAARLAGACLHREVEFIIPPGLVAKCDVGLAEVLLTNLLDNAVKFTSGRSLARIEFGRMERDGKEVFFVRDNGVGFDMAHAGALFGFFRRLHTDSNYPGTGIGLATCKTIVERHGGRIWGESLPDECTTFYFTFSNGQ